MTFLTRFAAVLLLLSVASPVAAETLLDRNGSLRAGDPQLNSGEYYDKYEVQIRAGDRLRITLTGTNYDPYVFVRLPDGSQKDNDDMAEGNQNSRIEVTSADAGTLSVYATSYEGGISGSYRVVVERLNGPSGSAGVASSSGEWIEGRLDYGDERHRDGSYIDYHTFSGRRGERVTVILESDDFDPYLFLLGPDGYQESNDDDGNSRNCRLAVTLPANGSYRVAINSYGEGAQVGDYRLRIERGSGSTPSSSSSAPAAGSVTAISFNRPVNGRLAAGDQAHRDGSYLDQYTFRGRAGQTVTIRLESTDFDPIVFLNGPNDYSQQNDDFNANDRNAQLTAVLPASGEYRIYANSYGEGPKEGAYRLSLNEGGNATGATASPALPALRLGAATTGTLAASDIALSSGEYRDCYNLELRAGQAVAVDLTSEDFDPYVFIRGPNDFSEDNNDFNNNRSHSRIEFSAPSAGTYRVYATSAASGETGRYRLLANNVGEERANVTTSSAGNAAARPLPRDRAVTGQLGSGSATLTSGEYHDIYTFSGRQGERIAIEMSSSAIDPYLCLRGQGVTLDNDDASENVRDARLELVLPRTGEYQVFATSYRPGEGGAYRLAFVTPGAAVVAPPDNTTAEPPDNSGDPDQTVSPDDPGFTDHGEEGGRVFGIFVGITDYPGEDDDLPLCSDDAKKLAESLRAARVSSAAEQRVLLDRNATIANVRRAFRELGSQVGPDDLFIFFHSGHGSQGEDGTSNGERDKRLESLVLYDEEMASREMAELLKGVRGRVALVALDCCFAGGFRNALTLPKQMGLFSSEEDLTSAIPEKFQAGGYLSHFIRAGLLGAADTDRDNRITAGELSEYLHRQYASEAAGVESSTLEGASSYQHLVVDRGGVKVNDLILSLSRVPDSLKYRPGANARSAPGSFRAPAAAPATTPAAGRSNSRPAGSPRPASGSNKQ